MAPVDKSSSLFAGGEDDPPLLMSSIDGVTTQVSPKVIFKHKSCGEQFIYLYGKEIEIWAGFGPVGNAEKKLG